MPGPRPRRAAARVPIERRSSLTGGNSWWSGLIGQGKSGCSWPRSVPELRPTATAATCCSARMPGEAGCGAAVSRHVDASDQVPRLVVSVTGGSAGLRYATCQKGLAGPKRGLSVAKTLPFCHQRELRRNSSSVLEEATGRAIEASGQLVNLVKADVSQPSFDLSDVGDMQRGRLSQAILRQSCCLP